MAAQGSHWFILVQPLAFILFITRATAETNRAPSTCRKPSQNWWPGSTRNIPACASPAFFLRETPAHVYHLGGGRRPFPGGLQGPVLPGVVWFLLKVYALIFLMMWFRRTFPRVRFDQLITLAWKVSIPLAFANLLVTA